MSSAGPRRALHYLSPGANTARSEMAPVTQRRNLGRHGDCTIARGAEIHDRGSIFTAQCAWPVNSAAAAIAAIATMRQDSVCSSADHNMTAYRVVDAKSRVLKEYDDDGEVGPIVQKRHHSRDPPPPNELAPPPQAHGGQRLLGCLTKLKAVGVAVVVSRVYGGQHLGKARSIGPGCGEPSSTQPSSTPIGALRAHLYCRARAARGARPSARGRHPACVGRRTGARRFPRSSRGGSAPRRARARARRPEEAKRRGHSSGGGAGGDGQARHARAGGRAQTVRWWRVGLISGNWGAGASSVSVVRRTLFAR